MTVYASVCTGMGMAELAFMPLAWECAYVAEIEPFPCHILHQRFGASRPRYMPDPLANDIDDDERALRKAASRAVSSIPEHAAIANVGDFTRIDPSQFRLPDVLIGGTPCQGFSLAGLRGSLADDRSNLALEFIRLAHATDALREQQGLPGLVVVWENVPGVLSMPDNAFGCVLGGFAGADRALVLPRGRGSWPDRGLVRGPRARAAWRICDAQYWNLAQRRERVFVVVGFRDRIDPAAVLLERQDVRGNTPPSREARKDFAGSLAPGSGGSCEPDDNDAANGRLIAAPLTAEMGKSASRQPHEQGALIPLVAGPLGSTNAGQGWRDDLETTGAFIPMAFGGNDTRGPIDVAAALLASERPHMDFETETLIAFSANDYGNGAAENISPSLRAMASSNGRPNSGQIMAIAFPHAQITCPTNRSNPQPGDPAPALAAGGQPTTVAIQASAVRENPASGPDGIGVQEELAYTLEARAEVQAVQTGWQVRRLTPTECERLQGAPDGFTNIT